MGFFEKAFKLGGELDKKTSSYIGIFGFFFILLFWYTLTGLTGWISAATIPSPIDVISSYKELIMKDGLFFIADSSAGDHIGPSLGSRIWDSNMFYSVGLNLQGYMEAILLALPIGFVIGLFPFFKSMFGKYIDAMRYTPITGLVGIFIAWFGIGTGMKAHFLAFGIIVYLLPIVIQRVYETEKVHLDTVWTLGATNWQMFTKVYFPSVMSKVFVDIRVITAISWTYIIVAEMVNNEGGVGSMIYLASRQGRIDKIFAVILFIIFFGFLQDKFFQVIEKMIFKYKFIKK